MPLQVKKVQLKVKNGNNYLDGDLLFNVDAEAWANGTREGVVITNPNDPAYHKNAKYYASKLPANPPTTAGLYALQVTIVNGNPVYQWVSINA